MKLYSSRQLLIVSGISAAVVLTAAGFLGFLKLPWEKRVKYEELDALNGTESQFVEDRDPAEYSSNEVENIKIYRELNSGVVNITTITMAYNWFLEPVPQEGTGSGSIIDQEGYVLTNYHVVKDAEELYITLADGRNYEGEITGADPENDLAVIKFDPEGKELVTIPFGSSSDLQIGQKVLAIGNPFALERTLTTGIVSGLGRPVQLSEEQYIIKEMIQTDASINPGNSGGPLLNAHGEMIGINTMIFSPSGGSVGIGFAVPIDTAKRIIPDLLEFGVVKRGWLDITPVQLFPQLVRYADLPVDQGLLVSEVTRGSSADKAGLKGGNPGEWVRSGRSIIYLGGDIIVEIDGTEIKGLADFYSALEDNKPGETVNVKVIRGRNTVTLNVELSSRF
jgi:S1-C subfamily serine protease